MQKTFTFRFYSVSKNSKTTPDLAGELRKIAAIVDKPKREKNLSSFYTVRLEELEDDGTDAIVGEIVRCQATNLPAGIKKDGKRGALDVDRLGHGVVFRYNFKKGVLGVQYDARVVSPGRILEYVAAFNANAIYSIAPKIDKKNWDRFNSGQTRKISIRIANPESMAELSGKSRSAGQGIKAMADAYNAPSILIELSMGHRRGFLADPVGSLAKQLAKMSVPGFRLDKLSAVTVVDDATEEIDLIEERLVAVEELPIDDRDPDKNYQIKKKFLVSQMKKLVG